jgi:menaquinol-cytochrome c reductase iron-sulfur subunit
MKRRTFLERIVQAFSLLIGIAFAAPVFTFLRSTFASGASRSSYPVGSIDSLHEEVTKVTFTRLMRDGWRVRTVEEYVWVRKNADGTVVVFEPHCTHLGCAYDWNAKSGQFLCPCHGGKFDKEGNRIEGPPPRSLDRFDVKLTGKQIRIGRVIKA